MFHVFRKHVRVDHPSAKMMSNKQLLISLFSIGAEAVTHTHSVLCNVCVKCLQCVVVGVR